MPDDNQNLVHRAQQRRRDLSAMAMTPAGRRVLSSLVADDKVFSTGFEGNSRDAYNAGQRLAALELRRELRNALPRDVFLDIVFPKTEECNGE